MSSAPSKPVRFADLGLRLVSGLVLAAIALGDIWLGGYWLGGLAAVAAGLMMWEHHRMVTGERSLDAPALIAMAVAAVWSVAATAIWGLTFGAAAILAGVVAVMVLAPRETRVWLVAGLVYMALAMCFLTLLRETDGQGFPLVVWLILVVIAADVGAYFVGRVVGGRKLWPAVSPGKTWSGAIGGLAIAVAVGLAFGAWSGWGLPRVALLSAVVAVASQAGDLLESAVKRRFGVKDSSQLVPGHGGLMDRLDGVMGALWVFAIYHLAGGAI